MSNGLWSILEYATRLSNKFEMVVVKIKETMYQYPVKSAEMWLEKNAVVDSEDVRQIYFRTLLLSTDALY